MCKSPADGVGPAGDGVTSAHELPNMGARKQPRSFAKTGPHA